jgi:hypothetical protein
MRDTGPPLSINSIEVTVGANIGKIDVKVGGFVVCGKPKDSPPRVEIPARGFTEPGTPA